MKTSNRIHRLSTLVIALVLLFTFTCQGLAKVQTKLAQVYVTQQEAVSAFVKSIGRNYIYGSSYLLSSFKGNEDIDEAYIQDYEKAITHGIIRSEINTPLRPKENITRIEALAMLAFTLPVDINATEKFEYTNYTDIPQWAKDAITSLGEAGHLTNYTNKTLGADKFIKADEFNKLIAISDEAYNTLNPGDSFYGYVNQKTFRNAQLNNPSYIDPLYGAVVLNNAVWSNMNDMATNITEKTEILLEDLLAGKITFEKGTPEQRIYDLMQLYAEDESLSKEDKELFLSYRENILKADNIEQLIETTNQLYLDTGIPTLFKLSAGANFITNDFLPRVEMVAPGAGGVLDFCKDFKAQNGETHLKLLSKFFSACNLTFTEEDLKKVVTLQEIASKGNDKTLNTILEKLSLLKFFGETEEADAILKKVLAEHPEYNADTLTKEIDLSIVLEKEQVSSQFKSYDIVSFIDRVGFSDYTELQFIDKNGIKEIDKVLKDESYLQALKLNAIFNLSEEIYTFLNKDEELWFNEFSQLIGDTVTSIEYKLPTDEELHKKSDVLTEIKDNTTEEELENIDLENLETAPYDVEDLINVTRSLPFDMGLMYCNHYYDDTISDEITKMVEIIWEAYIKRFEANTWMTESTKEAAIKKIENMICLIAYHDDLVMPEILSAKEGGTIFKNNINIQKNELNTDIRCCSDEEYARVATFDISPSMVNAFYSPNSNSMNIIAGIIQPPAFDKNASYASNMGSIGMVIAHEIGHAFDNTGSKFDEKGALKEWWSEEDKTIYEELQQDFVDYYMNFEVIQGVVQDSTITIGENMADFAAIRIIMDIFEGDEKAQKEALEAFATMWAQLGTASVLSHETLLSDVHSSNGVRVNATISSIDEFYELYNISEDDEMYVAPEDRLNLW